MYLSNNLLTIYWSLINLIIISKQILYILPDSCSLYRVASSHQLYIDLYTILRLTKLIITLVHYARYTNMVTSVYHTGKDDVIYLQWETTNQPHTSKNDNSAHTSLIPMPIIWFVSKNNARSTNYRPAW